jgi:hypothetical protein
MKQDKIGRKSLGKHPGGKLGKVGRVTFKWISDCISSEVKISHL